MAQHLGMGAVVLLASALCQLLAQILVLSALAAAQLPRSSTASSTSPGLVWSASGPVTTLAVGPGAVTTASVQQGPCRVGSPELPVVELSVSGARAAMLAGKLSCTGLVQAYLDRIQALDQRLQLNAVRSLSPTVLAEAEEADELLATALANGTADTVLPRLFCTPLLLKDNIDFAQLPTTLGTPALQGNHPPKDAMVTRLLREAGAIILGKANMGEMAFFPTFCISSIAGEVRNPYSLSHTPAGSSGGTAAAVAASFAMAGLGTDTGNSVRGPASHAGLVGLRPSLGLVSRVGVVPLRLDRDSVGPMARTVEDAVRLFEVMAVPDPDDPNSLLASGVEVPISFTQFLDPAGLVGMRVGVLRQISDLPGTDASILRAFGQALLTLQAAGAVLVDSFNITGNRYGLDWQANMYGRGPAIGNWNVNGRWEDLWGCQSPLREGLDAYLAGANSSVRLRSLQDIYAAGLYHPASQDELLTVLRAATASSDWPTPAMRAAGFICGCSWMWNDPCRTEFKERLIQSMDAFNVSVLVYPTWNQPPQLIGTDVLNMDEYGGNNSPMIAPHTGSPTITVPMGWSDSALPTGLSFLARPFDEGALIRAAFAYERASQQRRAPPLFPECSDPSEATSPRPEALAFGVAG